MMNYMLFKDGKRKALTLSYDDGVYQDKRFIETIDKYGLKCTFNLNSKNYTEEASGGRRRLNRAEAIELYSKAIENGHEVATHSFTHPFLDKLPPEMVSYEIIEDRRVLEDMFGVIVKGHAYPFGTTSGSVVEVLRNCGILYARTTVSTKSFEIPTNWLLMPATCHHNAPDLMQITDKFLNEPFRYDHPRLFYLWGHTYEFDDNNNWEVIERFGEAIGNRDDVWYANNMQVYEYVEAYRSLVFSANGNTVYNPTALTVWFISGGVTVKVEPGETVKIR